MVLVEGGCIHLKVHEFLMLHIVGCLKRKKTFLLVCVCLLLPVFDD